MKCVDCGQEFIGEHRVCDGCWDNRDWLLRNRAIIGDKAFQEVQRSMRNRRGTAKRKIEKLLEEIE